ncbi:MAG: hypothetical protein RLZZ618_1889 [Pseudomonadota bacterium]
MSSSPSQRIQSLLQDIRLASETQYELVMTVRKVALALGKDVSEEVKYGGILFSSAAPFGGIFAYAKHVTLEFSAGASLADPHGALEGAGKLRRHIKLVDAQDVTAKHVKYYLAAAHAQAREQAQK